MRKISFIIALLVSVSVMSFTPVRTSNDPSHKVEVIKNPDAGKPFIATCSGMNCGGGWTYAIWEAFVIGSYTTQGCTGIHTEYTQPCEPCGVCRSICATCSGGPAIIEPATYEAHTITVDKMSDNDARAYGDQLSKDYPDAHYFEIQLQGDKAVITFRVFK